MATISDRPAIFDVNSITAINTMSGNIIEIINGTNPA
jgi:hypothetical protein